MKEFYSKNRERVLERMDDDSIAILFSNPPLITNGDSELRFVQNTNLLYLSGIKQEETVLLLIKSEKVTFDTTVFTKSPDPLKAHWIGDYLTHEEIENISGISNHENLEELIPTLTAVIPSIKNIYFALNENPRASIFAQNNEQQPTLSWVKQRFPLHQYRRLSPILSQLRTIKSPEEIRLIKEAIHITDQGLRAMMKEIASAKIEFELEARLSYEFIKRGSRGVNGFAFTPIIASGKNSCVLHYTDNNQKLTPEQILLVDVGAEYQDYHADITRCFPTAKKFTPQMKTIYQAVLNILNESTLLLKPGVHFDTYKKQVEKIIGKELTKIKLIQSGESIKKYLWHGISHFLGLEVHDVGDYHTELKPGMVLTCEPGIYLPEEKIGIRLENDILITENGQENLSKKIPIEIDDIENLLN